ncbi:MAG TPA: hypothetical protein VG497_17495 [Kribbella sp.]|nr:hypothetical protein [Kribbella sp.]
MFSARLDVMIDGVGYAVDEVDAVRVPVSAVNPYGNAWTRQSRRHPQTQRLLQPGPGPGRPPADRVPTATTSPRTPAADDRLTRLVVIRRAPPPAEHPQLVAPDNRRQRLESVDNYLPCFQGDSALKTVGGHV